MAKKQDFLFEIGCDELPARFLKKLSHDLMAGVEQALEQAQLSFEAITPYASPRRIAVLVHQLDATQPEQKIERHGPFIKDAYDKNGTPTLACIGFARSCGVSVDQLKREQTPKGMRVAVSATQPGAPTAKILGESMQKVIKKLPQPKPMRWGSSDIQFLRQVKWVVMLWGQEVIDSTILGLPTGRTTYGHRFHSPDAIKLAHAADYAPVLEQQGHVIASFAERRSRIKQQLQKITAPNQVIIDSELLDEVTGLVEWPTALLGHFDQAFLKLPPEVLVTSMKTHQKCFPVIDPQQKLVNQFVLVSNIESKDPKTVVRGNERVIQARLADAAFFFENDTKEKLASRLKQLDHVIFQKTLGTIGDKVKRIEKLSQFIAKKVDADIDTATHGAQLSKCDLVTEMVFEFPNLQGVMGYYYARHDKEPKAVANIIQEHYYPRFSGDVLPSSLEGKIVALADRFDTIVGIIGLKQKPTGDKDPFALRRAALGICRILIDAKLDLDLKRLVTHAFKAFNDLPNENTIEDVTHFILERLKYTYVEKGVSPEIYEAVLATDTTNLLDFDRRVHAVIDFQALPEAESLAAANKRVRNILKKQEGVSIPTKISKKYLEADAETKLAELLHDQHDKVESLAKSHDYKAALSSLACLKEPIDLFFEEVMVMDKDEHKRKNRLALLSQIRQLFAKTADISLISG